MSFPERRQLIIASRGADIGRLNAFVRDTKQNKNRAVLVALRGFVIGAYLSGIFVSEDFACRQFFLLKNLFIEDFVY